VWHDRSFVRGMELADPISRLPRREQVLPETTVGMIEVSADVLAGEAMHAQLVVDHAIGLVAGPSCRCRSGGRWSSRGRVWTSMS